MRNEKIANAGLLAMMMVVGIHVTLGVEKNAFFWWWNNFTVYGLFTIAVPLFFIVAGYFLTRHSIAVLHDGTIDLKDSWWRVAVTKRVRTLLIPYLLWCFISRAIDILVFASGNVFHSRPVLTNMEWVLENDWALDFGLNVFDYPTHQPFWYMRALILLVAISPLVIWWLRRWNLIGLGSIFLIWAVSSLLLTGHPRLGKFFGVFFSLNGLFFFALGCWIAHNVAKAQTFERLFARYRWLLLICSITLLTAKIVMLAWTNYRFRLFSPILIPMMLAAFWEFVPSCHWPRMLTGMTFAIYLIHPFVWSIVGVGHTLRVVSIGGWFLKWLIGFGGAWIGAMVLSRFLPRVSAVLFGGRIGK